MASSQSDFVATVPAVRDYGAGWKAVEGPAKAIAGLRFDPRQAG